MHIDLSTAREGGNAMSGAMDVATRGTPWFISGRLSWLEWIFVPYFILPYLPYLLDDVVKSCKFGFSFDAEDLANLIGGDGPRCSP